MATFMEAADKGDGGLLKKKGFWAQMAGMFLDSAGEKQNEDKVKYCALRFQEIYEVRHACAIVRLRSETLRRDARRTTRRSTRTHRRSEPLLLLHSPPLELAPSPPCLANWLAGHSGNVSCITPSSEHAVPLHVRVCRCEVRTHSNGACCSAHMRVSGAYRGSRGGCWSRKRRIQQL